jgi:predicted short-subunit dehydrogenase-like oxidoreductase (DUF2520 family)
MHMIQSVGILGCGALGRNLFHNLKSLKGLTIKCFCRSIEKDDALYKSSVREIEELFHCDLILIAVSDQNIVEVGQLLTSYSGIIAHCSGATPLHHFNDKGGVFYPLQSFSKSVIRSFKEIPLFIEGNNEETTKQLYSFAQRLSNQVEHLSSEKRQKLHLAAVMSQNFSNHLIALTQAYLEKEAISFQALIPLLEEGLGKALHENAKEIQSGPARRKDTKTLETHLSLLKEEKRLLPLYEQLSESIRTYYEEDF